MICSSVKIVNGLLLDATGNSKCCVFPYGQITCLHLLIWAGYFSSIYGLITFRLVHL